MGAYALEWTFGVRAVVTAGPMALFCHLDFDPMAQTRLCVVRLSLSFSLALCRAHRGTTSMCFGSHKQERVGR